MESINDFLGLNVMHLTLWQMMIRGVVIFFSALLLIRIAGIHTLGRQTAFDQLTSLILGSILGRAVVTGQPLFASLGAALTLVLLRKLLAWVTFKSHKVGLILKGNPMVLFSEGKMHDENLKKELITEEDIKEALRLSINIPEKEKCEEIYLERSGEISFVMRDRR